MVSFGLLIPADVTYSILKAPGYAPKDANDKVAKDHGDELWWGLL